MNIDKIFSDLAQYEILMNQAADMVENLKNQIKDYMRDHEIDTLQGTEHAATYKLVTSNRFNSKALKTDNPDLYAMYTTPTSSQRFIFK